MSPYHAPTLSIDPGCEQSGWCVFQNGKIEDSGIDHNSYVLSLCRNWGGDVAIEMIASYGMAVGKDVFETVRWIGRFQQASQAPEYVKLVYRKDVKMHLCNSMKAKDANIRQAIIDMFGGKDKAIGKKAAPGPLYGVKSHAWAAVGVALTACAAGR